jgi:hypothetical protein
MAQTANERVAAILQKWLNERTAQMVKILEVNEITRGPNQLPSEIAVPPITISIGNVGAELDLPDYYVFTDEGVKGIGGGYKSARSTGRYSFKNLYVSKAMVDSLQEWNARKGRKGITKETMRSDAFGTAVNVKKHGVGQTLFFTKALDQRYVDQLEQRLLEELGQEVEVNISIPI